MYVVFEAKGDTNAVDSPSELYITVGTACSDASHQAAFQEQSCDAGMEVQRLNS